MYFGGTVRERAGVISKISNYELGNILMFIKLKGSDMLKKVN